MYPKQSYDTIALNLVNPLCNGRSPRGVSMDNIFKYLEATPIYRQLLETLKKEKRITLNDVSPDLTMLLILLIERISQRDIVVVNPNLYQAQKMYDRLHNVRQNIRFFPQDEFITTEMLAMSEELKFERLSTIKTMIEEPGNIVITHPTGFIKKMLPLAHYKKAIKSYKIGENIELEGFLQTLVEYGYSRVTTVENVGEFAQRGSIIDIFIAENAMPIRIDLFDTEIETIRYFDVNTQRSIESEKMFTIMPRSEFFFNEKEKQSMIQAIHQVLENETFNEQSRQRVLEEIEYLNEHQRLDQLSRYNKYLTPALETISDYLNEPIVIYIDHEKVKQNYLGIVNDLTDWLLEGDDYHKLDFDFIVDLDSMSPYQMIIFNAFESNKQKTSITIRGKEAFLYQNDFQMLKNDLMKYDYKTTVLIALKDVKRLEHLEELLEDRVMIHFVKPHESLYTQRVNVVMNPVPLSFEWHDANLVVLNESNIYRERVYQTTKYKSVFKDTKKISTAKELKKGDYIVHYDHGIGRFLGIKTMDMANHVNDYIMIQYRGEDTLYIPVENIHLVQKYVAHEGLQPKLSKLGGVEWSKTKAKVKKKVKDIAEYLIRLYAERSNIRGFAFSPDNDLMDVFEADFNFEETEDQLKAIADVKEDMEKPQPMDRLICGDVGYGKTEVALRATFKAALDNKQIAYLAPTTVLARQHYYTFKDRLEKHGIKTALLSRFVTKKEQQKTLEQLSNGLIDVVIGTHRLLSKDIVFKDLGLLIIDEEQRFGVEHKEKIKALRKNVDVLSLSATPIPRTLQMSLSGVKKMSLLETPPKNRLPVQTYVLQRNDHVIKDAIERELARNGQVFYLYNRVGTIDLIEDKLSRLVPHARFVYAHGKMSRLRLEKVITEFLDYQYDVLVSTTIIETGIDIPNANTLIIHDADYLGLSQLYQIRGRVGRSDRIAYSYLMYQKNKQLTEEASKRLRVIKEFTELGSGYKIAMRDLAIRGAGDILGTQQSGFIDSVGMDLFLDMLKEAVEEEKHEQKVPLLEQEKQKQTIKIAVDKTIDEDYISDEDTRIELHKRFTKLSSSNDIIVLKDELTDRFGNVPSKLIIYMLSKVYEHLAIKHGIEKVYDKKRTLELVFSQKASAEIDGEKLFYKASELPEAIKLFTVKKQIHIEIEKYRVEKHFLHYLVELLETI